VQAYGAEQLVGPVHPLPAHCPHRVWPPLLPEVIADRLVVVITIDEEVVNGLVVAFSVDEIVV
jgi:hypothetical protein